MRICDLDRKLRNMLFMEVRKAYKNKPNYEVSRTGKSIYIDRVFKDGSEELIHIVAYTRY